MNKLIDGKPAKKINTKNKCDAVVDSMLDMIGNGNYKPGDRLPPENDLCEIFGVSRVTIRESFKKLSIMGIVSIRQGEGTFVNQITAASLINQLYPLLLLSKDSLGTIYEARLCLETGIAELAAANRTDEDLEHLRSLIEPMENCIDTANYKYYNQLDIQFHLYIAQSSKNDILISMFMMLDKVRQKGIALTNISLEAMKVSTQKHIEIVDAIENREIRNIGALMNMHINYSKQSAVKKMGHGDC